MAGSNRIEDIAKKAGLNYGPTYYFNSKDKLFHIVVHSPLDSTLAFYYTAAHGKAHPIDSPRLA
jgi:AcrR family transcriptional regulator